MTAIAAFPRLKSGIRRLSTVLLVDRIEPCLDFWVERLGFEVRLQVEGDEQLDFVALCRNEVEVVYRTVESLHIDTPGLVDTDLHSPWVVIYMEVDDIDELMPRLEGVEVVIPMRETMFGTREIYLREPSGRILSLSSQI